MRFWSCEKHYADSGFKLPLAPSGSGNKDAATSVAVWQMNSLWGIKVACFITRPKEDPNNNIQTGNIVSCVKLTNVIFTQDVFMFISRKPELEQLHDLAYPFFSKRTNIYYAFYFYKEGLFFYFYRTRIFYHCSSFFNF